MVGGQSWTGWSAGSLWKVQVKDWAGRIWEVTVDHCLESWVVNLGLTESCPPGSQVIRCQLFEISCRSLTVGRGRWLLFPKTGLILPQSSGHQGWCPKEVKFQSPWLSTNHLSNHEMYQNLENFGLVKVLYQVVTAGLRRSLDPELVCKAVAGLEGQG